MKLHHYFAPLTLSLLALSSSAIAGQASRRALPLRDAEAEALRAISAPELGSLRAGTVDRQAALHDSERNSLRSAEAQSPDLADLRAGDGAGTILAAVLIVVLILLIV